MIKKIIWIAVIVLGVITLFLSGKDISVQWNGTIKTKNGMTIIKNPIKPVHGDVTLEIQENLVLRHGKDEDDVFGDICKLSLDKEGNIYLMDQKRFLITSFSPQGKFRLQFGAPGAGPGEFKGMFDFFVGNNGNIYILDLRLIHIFSPIGKPINQLKLNQSALDCFVTEKGKYIISFFSFNNDLSSKDHVVAYSTRPLITEKELARYPLNKVIKRKVGEGVIFYNLFHDYTPAFCFARSWGDTCVFGFPTDYRFNVVNGNGQIIKVIENAAEAVEISGREKDVLKKKIAYRYSKWPKQVFNEALVFPAHRPFFRKFLVDDLDRIFVERIMSVVETEQKSYEFDVYDKNGYFIYKVQLPVSPDLIRNGHLYYIDTQTDENEVFVRRSKITNWQILKNFLGDR